MRLLWIALKDLTVTARDPKTVLLMFAAPLVIMLLVGAIFFAETGVQPETMKQVSVGACVLDPGEHAQTFVSEMAKRFTVTQGSGVGCAERMDGDLSIGRIRAYFVVPDGFSANITEGRQAGITLKADNAKPDIASIVTSVSQGIVYSAAQEMGQKFVQASWEELSNMSASVSGLVTELGESERQVSEIRNKTSATAQKIGAVDTNTLRASIRYSRASIESLATEASALQESVNSSADEVDGLSQSMGELQAAVTNISTGVGVLRGDITRIESELDSAYSDAYCEQAGSLDILNNTFFSRWKSICGDILSLNNSMATLDKDLANQTTYLMALNSSAADTQANLTQVRAKIAEVQGRLGALSELSELNDTLAYMERSVEEFQVVQEEASANLNETSGILDSVSARIADLKLGAAGAKSKLDSLVSRDPRSIITPLTLSTSSLFGPIRYLDAMFPAILAVILMFVTVLFSAVTVIREKQTGTLKRVLLSPATSLEFVLGKVALVLAVAVLQAAMLLLVAATVFAIRINWALVPYAFAVVALASVTFASIGMIIAALSDSENTALLAALVVCIPMLFLSGVFFPRELMIAPVSLISLLSPLTHAVVLLEQFLVYSVDPFAAGAFMTGLLLWTIASLALSARLVSKLRMK